MDLKEAADHLRKAGLYVRPGDSSIFGGSHVDTRHLIRMVENGFIILKEGVWYRVRTHLDGQGEGKGNLTLEEAVQLVIETIKLQPDVEAELAPISKGPVYL